MGNEIVLSLVKRKLIQGLKAKKGENFTYRVPRLWISPQKSSDNLFVNPYQFYLNRIEYIESQNPEPCITGGSDKRWSDKAVIYNIFVRATTGYDHNNNNKININPIGDGWMETGTFLKSIAILPLIKKMGFNTVHLLPLTAIGEDGSKGTLGSIYATRNHYKLDPRLSEPALGLKTEKEFVAFVEAAHHLGIRVTLEFALRTVSKDADVIGNHPKWVYWICADIPDRKKEEMGKKGYGPPTFTREELKQIKSQVREDNFEDLIPPKRDFREMFTPPPKPDNVEMIDGSWIGWVNGTRVRVAGAFCDWPPDNPQPPWTDVTYLRFYDQPDFNYIAYNTVRMYDDDLARPENRVGPLWKHINDILPHYQQNFNIDGAVIDMAHALPPPLEQSLMETAREINPNFAFWDESFEIPKEKPEVKYDAVIGNYFWVCYRPKKLVDKLLTTCAEKGFPIPFFAAPESHNTPRAAARFGKMPYARLVWVLGCFLPALPYCHSGFELTETLPVNTGIDFKFDELRDYPTEDLPLFSEVAYGWENGSNLIGWIRRTLEIRAQFRDLITDRDPTTFDLLSSSNPHIWTVVRSRNQDAIGIIFNLNGNKEESFRIQLPTDNRQVVDELSRKTFPLNNGVLEASFEPLEYIITCL